MEYRKHKSLKISEIGIGTYALSGVYGAKDLEEFKRMIYRAYELGVNFFDTAEAYGNAEQILGDIVKPFREDIYIATKVGIRGDIKPNLSKDYIKKACEESLKRLQTDYIDLYQVHFHDPTTPIEETVEALEDLVEEGKIKHYGVGHLPLDVTEEYCKLGKPFSVLTEFSAVTRESYEKLLPLYKKYNLGIIAFSTTGRGLLTGRFKEGQKFEPADIRYLDPLFQRERFQYGLRIAKKFAELGEKYGKTPVQVAIAWVLAHEGIICALTGPSTVKHLEENVEASGWEIPKEDLRELDEFFKREDEWLRQKQKESIKQILIQPLQEPQRAFVDLIYVIETALSLSIIEEKEILSIFYELYGLRKKLDKEEVSEKLRDIQAELRKVIPLDAL
ncbi:aldo/keto reductase [Thermococcus argininiproducens]|uniref:Aldo/keto reductase n=1 Tax=Thermococcus argininiproducens TaxID=2866384 RepID=A0A9E7SCC2_9EURY|nr:aldo/keto reductase [Thermococcus argininiproducens]USG99650.1 aldo/keto reductase [Thermococcus argininiproducens]